jgi:hypothetical protein
VKEVEGFEEAKDMEEVKDVGERKTVLAAGFVGRGFNRDIQKTRIVGFSSWRVFVADGSTRCRRLKPN